MVASNIGISVQHSTSKDTVIHVHASMHVCVWVCNVIALYETLSIIVFVGCCLATKVFISK